ncbi:MAG: M28 family metallopeptidase, partial [candidate division Zixibacteria bacterium]
MTPRIIFIAISILICCINPVFSADLYKISLSSQAEADFLNSLGILPLIQLSDGYLLVAETQIIGQITDAKIKISFMAENVDIDNLFLDRSRNGDILGKNQLLYEQGDLRICSNFDNSNGTPDLLPIKNRPAEFIFKPESMVEPQYSISSILDLEELISQVEIDSLESYVLRLEAFYRRWTGTDSCFAARDWLVNKFAAFGYDSIYTDLFEGCQRHYIDGDLHRIPQESYNVIVTKIGSIHPDKHIIVGAHYDGVWDCPAADDNGSGTAGLLEIARILANVETEITIVFIAFDSEECSLDGSSHYVDNALENNEDILTMMNIDMIGYKYNYQDVTLYHGSATAYGELWQKLADSLMGMNGILSGSHVADHWPFQMAGYDVLFVHEYNFSIYFHTLADSAVYLNFTYITNVVKSSLATCYVTSVIPYPLEIISIIDIGNGNSLEVYWPYQDGVDFYRVYYDTNPPNGIDSADIYNADTNFVIDDLIEGKEYAISVASYDSDGSRSILQYPSFGTPYHLPRKPSNLTIKPNFRCLEIEWTGNNDFEADFSHYSIIRDGKKLPVQLSVSFYVDNDYSLGGGYHSYYVVAVDQDGNISDTVGMEPLISKVATLTAGKILAINRSNNFSNSLVNEVVTGEYLRESLSPFDFEYYSDTAYNYLPESERLNLYDLLEYELVVVGSESGRAEDLGIPPNLGGILDVIDYYQSIGGKVILFNRWGNITIQSEDYSTIHFIESSPDYYYQSRY